MTRPLDPATKTALGGKDLPFAALVYLDILDDPLIVWNGLGDLTFGAAETGDSSLDGKTFAGTASVIQISSISEGVGGSDALEISMPGVDPYQPAMRQLITNRNRWQFRRAVVWLMALDPETDAIAGKPFRIKTGRMDRLPFKEDNRGVGTIVCRIEGHQAYGNIPLGTRYSEQRDINPNDISQNFVHSLANMSPEMGQGSSSGGSLAGAYSGALRDGGFIQSNNTRVV